MDMDIIEGANEARRIAKSFNRPLVVHHYDADGITSGAIVVNGLKAMGKPVERMWVKTLDDTAIDTIIKKAEKDKNEVIFVDLGSGHKRVDEVSDALVIDHHQPLDLNTFQFNPHRFGIDGSTELSASGSAYLVFGNDIEFAITGAIGDMQYPFVGKNKDILDEGVKEDKVVVEKDLSFYGRYSRPLESFLLYSDEPYIPGFSFNERAVADFIKRIDVDPSKPYIKLTKDKKQELITSIVDLMMRRGKRVVPEQLIRDNYVFPRFEGTIMYEAQELSTILNACGRNEKADVGVDALLGSEDALEQAKGILRVHRRNLRAGVEYATRNLTEFSSFYIVDARGIIGESIIGIVCGMILQNRGKPIIGISKSTEGRVKISGRSKVKGINLGIIMRECGAKCGGIGGGHTMAAGAHVPERNINEFLRCLNDRFVGSTSNE